MPSSAVFSSQQSTFMHEHPVFLSASQIHVHVHGQQHGRVFSPHRWVGLLEGSAVITHTVEGNEELDNDIMEMKIASSTLSPKSIINMLSWWCLTYASAAGWDPSGCSPRLLLISRYHSSPITFQSNKMRLRQLILFSLDLFLFKFTTHYLPSHHAPHLISFPSPPRPLLPSLSQVICAWTWRQARSKNGAPLCTHTARKWWSFRRRQTNTTGRRRRPRMMSGCWAVCSMPWRTRLVWVYSMGSIYPRVSQRSGLSPLNHPYRMWLVCVASCGQVGHPSTLDIKYKTSWNGSLPHYQPHLISLSLFNSRPCGHHLDEPPSAALSARFLRPQHLHRSLSSIFWSLSCDVKGPSQS